MPSYIKQILVGSTNYDLNVLAIQDEQGNPKTWTDITGLVQAGFTILAPWTQSDYESTTAPTAAKLAEVPAGIVVQYNSGASTATGTLAASTAETKRHIYLVYHPHNGTDAFDEYVSVGSGSSSAWEKIGNTDIDLSTYAKKTEAAKPGTYTTSTPSTNTTSSAGAETITTSSAGSQTATGTATITYDKANNATGSNHGEVNADTGSAGGFTIDGSNFTFTGTTATITATVSYQPAGSISGSQTVADHSHAFNASKATTTVVTDITEAETAGSHEHTLDSHTHAAAETVIKSTGLMTASVHGFTGGARNFGFSASVTNVMYSPTVVSEVLQWSLAGAETQDAHSTETKTFVTGVASNGTVSVAGAASAATLTTSSAGGHTHSISFSTTSVTYVTGATIGLAGGHTVDGSNFSFTGTTATLSSTVSYQPAGTISGEQTVSGHSHSYKAPSSHTHSISYATTTVTGEVEVAVTDHTHTVTVSGHTHDLGNHTHSVTIDPISNS